MDLNRFRDFWKGLEPRGQMTLVGAGLAVLVTAFLLYQLGSRPSYSTIASGLAATDTADVTKSLEAAGIAYKLGNGGTSISVQDGQAAAARVALAKSGLPRGGHVGWELFDKKSLGVTDFQQKVDYQRALEGEIARTIEQIAGVQSAQVALVLPDETLFASEGPKASASVLLNANSLDSSTVKGIAHLVASSVKGLDAQEVTITDNAGQLLWPTADSGGMMSANSKLAAEQQYSAQVASQLNALISSTLGPGKAQAKVHADLSLDQTTVDKVTYGKKGVPLQTSVDNEVLGSSGGGATGAPAGVSSNVPSYAAGAAAGKSKSNYNHQVGTTTFGVDKTISHTTVAPGTVNRLDVALMVDSSVPKAQLASLKTAIASAVGINTTRGDTLAVTSVKFATPPAAKTVSAGPLGAINPISIAKTAAAVLGALIFLFLMRRNLKKREGEASVPEPTWLREISGAMPLSELESTQRLALESANDVRPSAMNELEEIARTQPEQVAIQVKQWMKD